MNDATIMKHIWNLFYRNDSIWVAWVREVLLRRSQYLDRQDTLAMFLELAEDSSVER